MYYNKCNHSPWCSSLNNKHFFAHYQHLLIVFTAGHYPLPFHPLTTTDTLHNDYTIYTLLDMAWVSFYKANATAYLPAVIHYHTHFLLTIITHVGGSNGVKTGPMKHWPPFLNNTPFKSRKILFNARGLGSNLL